MKAQYYGKNIQLRENFKEEVQKKIDRLDKYFHETAQANITFQREGRDMMRAEITIRIPGVDTIFRADQTSLEMLDAVDRCVESLVSQIRKHKTKLEKYRKDKRSIRFEMVEDLPDHEKTSDEPEIARVKELELIPMSPEEACLQMELLDHDFFMFLNGDSGQINVVYRRKAGNYGLLMPR